VNSDARVIAGHWGDAGTEIGGTLVKLGEAGQRLLLIDPTDGEPTGFAFGVDASNVYERKRRALGVRISIFQTTATGTAACAMMRRGPDGVRTAAKGLMPSRSDRS
jgi:hypothetical protein